MISISHWGMFDLPPGSMIRMRFAKAVSQDDLPQGWLEEVPAYERAAKPVYQRLNFGKLD